MTLSAALDSGLAFSLLVVFFGFIYPGWMADFKWWGTEVYKQYRVVTGKLAHTKLSRPVNILDPHDTMMHEFYLDGNRPYSRKA
ncbi:hypothetical protein MMC13_001184 [Lambiella insularis]|nr:hypothetical protein [Lambiella insularis]